MGIQYLKKPRARAQCNSVVTTRLHHGDAFVIEYFEIQRTIR